MKTSNLSVVTGVAAAALLSFGGTNAHAASVINFDSFGFGDLGTNTLILPEASFVSTDGLFNIGPEGLCAFSPGAFNCEEDLAVNFTSSVSNLTFETFGFNFGDQITVDVFGAGGLLGDVIKASNGLVDLTAFSNVNSLNIRFTGTGGAGFSYNNFTFDEATTAIPTPALLPGLIGMGVAALRKRGQGEGESAEA